MSPPGAGTESPNFLPLKTAVFSSKPAGEDTASPLQGVRYTLRTRCIKDSPYCPLSHRRFATMTAPPEGEPRACANFKQLDKREFDAYVSEAEKL